MIIVPHDVHEKLLQRAQQHQRPVEDVVAAIWDWFERLDPELQWSSAQQCWTQPALPLQEAAHEPTTGLARIGAVVWKTVCAWCKRGA